VFLARNNFVPLATCPDVSRPQRRGGHGKLHSHQTVVTLPFRTTPSMFRAIPLLTLVRVPSLVLAQDALPQYKPWQFACAKLPTNRDLKGKLPDKKLLPLPAFADYERELDGLLKLKCEGPLGDRRDRLPRVRRSGDPGLWAVTLSA
jgi:hypothetical protein